MKIDTRYFEYLSLLHLDSRLEKLSVNFMACKNKSMLPSTNRVFIKKRVTEMIFNNYNNFMEIHHLQSG